MYLRELTAAEGHSDEVETVGVDRNHLLVHRVRLTHAHRRVDDARVHRDHVVTAHARA